MTKILMRSPKDPFHVMTVPEVLQRSVIGGNSGNLLFSTAVHKFLLTEGTEITPNQLRADPEDADRVNETYDLFVVPLANAFRLDLEPYLRRLTELVKRLRIPVVIFGVGTQADLNYDLSKLRPINETVRDLVGAVLDRSASIGVRGECTAEYLRGLGFRDVEVIGCPSMFMNGDTLRVEKKASRLEKNAKVAISATTRGACDQKMGSIIAANQARYPHLLYVAQSHRDFELMYWGDTARAAGRESDSPVHLSHPLFRENRTRAYLDPSVWIDDLTRYDFAFGTRIHGSVAALLAGVPSAVLCHDSRTLELCRYFDIPHRRLPDVPGDLDAADLYAEADFGPLVSGHRERFERLVAFMDRNGLRHIFGPGGDQGAAFDQRMRRTTFPPGVTAWDGSDDGQIGHRIAWLKEQLAKVRGSHTTAAQRQSELNRRVERLERGLTALEERLGAPGSVRPAPRFTRRTLRRPLGARRKAHD